MGEPGSQYHLLPPHLCRTLVLLFYAEPQRCRGLLVLVEEAKPPPLQNSDIEQEKSRYHEPLPAVHSLLTAAVFYSLL